MPPSHPARPGDGARAVRRSVALLTLGAAVIHLAVVPEHLREWWVFGAGFIVFAVVQAGWSALVWRGTSQAVVTAGLVGNVALLLLWVVSRTVGLPVGPQAGTPEAAMATDVLCAVLELVAAAGAGALLVPAVRLRAVAGRAAAATVGSAAVLSLSLTGVAVAATGGHDAEPGPAHAMAPAMAHSPAARHSTPERQLPAPMLGGDQPAEASHG